MYVKLKHNNLAAIFFLSTSFLALLFALLLEHWLGFVPCMLCLYERWPYFITTLLSIAILYKKETIMLFMPTIFFTIFIGVIISAYHIGVEYHIFRISESCGMNYENIDNIAALYDQISYKKIARCDQPVELFGIPVSYLNLIYSLAMICIGYVVYRRYGNQKNQAEYNKG